MLRQGAGCPKAKANDRLPGARGRHARAIRNTPLMGAKFVALIRAPDSAMRRDYRRTFDIIELRGLTGNMRGLRRVVSNVVDDEPATDAGMGSVPIDVVAEFWFETADQGACLLRAPGCVAAYRVTELIEKCEAPMPGDPPRARLFSFIRPLEGMPRSEFRRHWDGHVPIALRVHAACTQYVRHWVEACLRPEAEGHEAWGIGLISLRDQEDREQRLFDSADGRAEVMADTAEFVGGRRVVFATVRCELRNGVTR